MQGKVIVRTGSWTFELLEEYWNVRAKQANESIILDVLDGFNRHLVNNKSIPLEAIVFYCI